MRCEGACVSVTLLSLKKVDLAPAGSFFARSKTTPCRIWEGLTRKWDMSQNSGTAKCGSRSGEPLSLIPTPYGVASRQKRLVLPPGSDLTAFCFSHLALLQESIGLRGSKGFRQEVAAVDAAESM